MTKCLKFLFVFFITSFPLYAQMKTVTGKVTDEHQVPLPGVSVVIQGTSKGTATDFDGNYTIEVQEGSVLTYSSVGFVTQQKKISGGSNRLTVNISLQELREELSEVVVVGYGSQKKENLTGAIASIDSKELESRPLTNIGQGLQGLIPNLNVNAGNGRPGQDADFNIRGFTSLSNASPLVLVDGVQMDANQINPDEVESVTVLKDAASAAIYGGRAAFGVILITTKKGKKDMPTRISLSTNYSLARPTRLPELVNSLDYVKMYMAASETGQLTGGTVGTDIYTDDDLNRIRAYIANPSPELSVYIDPTDPRKYRYAGNTNWVKEMYPGFASQTQHNISLSGGSEKTSYIASFGKFSQEGLFKQSQQTYNRYNLSLGVNSDITKWLTVNLKTTLNRKDNDRPADGQNGVSAERFVFDLKPLMPVKHPDGNYSGQGDFTNPFAMIAAGGRNKYVSDDFWVTGGIVLNPLKNVKIIGDYTWNTYRFNGKINTKRYKEYGAPTDGVSIFDPTMAYDLGFFPYITTAYVEENNSHNRYASANIYAQYENTFASKHYLKVMAGYNQEEKHYEGFSATAKNLLNQDYPYLRLNNDEKPTVGSNISDWALLGTFFRFNYIYADKYLLEINGRYDGSSRFSRDSRYVFSPSMSLGWRISKEAFFAPLEKVVNDLKFRVSYGKLPNQVAVGDYPYLATMDLLPKTGYVFGNEQQPFILAPGLVSGNFTWENVETRNFGVDFGLFANRLSGSFDYYVRDTKGMLVDGTPLPAVLGTAAPQRNAANLQTKGFELMISWKDRISDDLSYRIAFNLADSRSFITKYDLNPSGSLTDYYEGREIGEIWGYTTEGLYQTDAEAAVLDNSKLAAYQWLAGDVKYADLNGDGEISNGNNTLDDHGDLSIIGNQRPRYTFGANLGFDYKNFDLTMFFQGVGKRDAMLSGTYFWGFTTINSVPTTQQLDYWTAENPDAYYPRLRFNGTGNIQTQTRYLQDASYVRLKQITLGYTLPKDVLTKHGIENLRIYITGQNVFEFTKLLKSYDPELLSQDYPLNRLYTLGVQLRF